MPEEGAAANLTIFSTAQTTVLTEKNNVSKSRNSPFLNTELRGKVLGVIKGSRSFFNQA
jgi:dihydroorotase